MVQKPFGCKEKLKKPQKRTKVYIKLKKWRNLREENIKWDMAKHKNTK